MLTKADFEKRINDAEIFSMNCKDNPAYYDTLKRKFYMDLTNYYLQFVNSSIVELYGLELIETANDCLQSFKITEGTVFLHYFNTSFARACKKYKVSQVNAVMRGAMHITAEDSKDTSKILKLFEREKSILCDDTLEITNEEFIAKASCCLGISIKRVRELIVINENSKNVGEWHNNEEGEEESIFDFIADDSATVNNKIIAKDKIIELFDSFDFAYSELQERTKPIIKELFTVYVLKNIDFCKNIELMYDYDCFDDELINQFIDFDILPSARDISNKYSVNEASASRTLKSFIEKIKLIIKN